MGFSDEFKKAGLAIGTGGLSLLGEVPDLVDDITGASGIESAAKEQAAAALQSEREARELNIERYGEAEQRLSPYLEGSESAYEQLQVELGLAPGEAGTAYMDAPGYKTAMEGVKQSMAGSGTLYSGARIGASQQAQGQFYTNYMNMLQEIGNPNVATNLSSLGVGQGATMGQQQQQAQQAASGYLMGGAQAIQAGRGDIIAGGAKVAGGAMSGGYI